MGVKMKTLIDEIVASSLDELKNDDNIVSIFLVGSMSHKDYQEKVLNDYDIRFIVKEMNLVTYEKITCTLENIKLEILKNGIGCQISDVIGPAKMQPIKDRNILIHGISMTETDLDNLPNIHKYSYYKSYEHIYGVDLISKYRNLIITPDDVIFSVEGIDFCIDLIKSKKNSYTKWQVDDNKLVLKREYINIDDYDMLELFYYAYNKAKDNIINMIKTNNLKVNLDDYLDMTSDELCLIDKIEGNRLSLNDIGDSGIYTIKKILYKLEQACLKITKSHKQFYNSLEWGIIDTETREMRKNGFDYLKQLKLPTGNNFSVKYSEYLLKKNEIAKIIENSAYIVIFEPPNKDCQRYGITNVDSISVVDDYLAENNFNLDNYNVSFVEMIKERPDSYAGTLLSDGTGNTIIETIDRTCDSRLLTSTGADSQRIKYYHYLSFDDQIRTAPREINEIKEICQYFRGYYEFAYGEIRGLKDIYFTYYSPNDKYINIFEGGKRKCKNITK